MAKKLLLLLLLLLVPPRQSLESIMLKQYPPMELDITISIGSQPESKERTKRSAPNALSAAIVRLYLLQHVSLYLRPNIKVEPPIHV